MERWVLLIADISGYTRYLSRRGGPLLTWGSVRRPGSGDEREERGHG